MTSTGARGRHVAFALAAVAVVTLPYWSRNEYQLHVASLIAVYWILIAGLNLVVGFTGQLSIGHVGLLALGAYTFAILGGKFGLHPMLAVVVAGVLGGLCGFLVGLPSLRLPEFYFAMSTMAFALIVTELALARGELTGGGVGLPAPAFGGALATPAGFYWLVLGIGALVTWLIRNVARFMWGRALVSIRDSVVAARSVGVSVYRAKLVVFVFSGVTAGVAGALFSSLQSYITPDTFIFELGLFFFVSIIIGGRGSILGPFLGTVVLTALPELVAPLAKLGTFFYGFLLLAVVLLIPEGLGRVVRQLLSLLRPVPVEHPAIEPDLARLRAALLDGPPPMTALAARSVTKEFGGLRALDGVSLDVRPGEVHGLIGPNGSGKTTLLNLLSGYYQPDAGSVVLGDRDLSARPVQERARLGVARTFQTPRLLATLTVLDNVMLGGWPDVRSSFVGTALSLPRARSEEAATGAHARALLEGVGLAHAADRRANLLEHAEQRFLEIARALAMRPRFVMLDEPAGGLTIADIEHLGAIIQVIKQAGIGVLLVEHHTDFVFRISDRVTTLDLGRVIAHGTPDVVRKDAEVVRVYLGG